MPDKKKKNPKRIQKENSRKKPRTSEQPRLRLKQGTEWKEEFRYRSEILNSLSKNAVAGFLAISFVVLLFTLTAYGMKTNNPIMIGDMIQIDKAGLFLLAVWATGKVLNGWKDHN